MTAGQPGLMMPAFAAAIFSSVSPSTSVWSSPMLQITETSGASMTLVESSSPPMPTSITTIWQPRRTKYSIAMHVTSSNSVGDSVMDAASGRMYSVMAHSSSSEIISSSTCIRSLNLMMYGEV